MGNQKSLNLWNYGTLELWNSGTMELWNYGTLEYDAIVLNPLRGICWFLILQATVLHPLRGRSVKHRA